jgi:hypothetical protein
MKKEEEVFVGGEEARRTEEIERRCLSCQDLMEQDQWEWVQ